MLQAESILRTSSPKKCAMARTSDDSGIPSCLAFLILLRGRFSLFIPSLDTSQALSPRRRLPHDTAHSASPVISLLSPVHPSSVAYRMFPIYAAPVVTYFWRAHTLVPSGVF